jgi:putative tryptophan/tyrosine transport system substrate-binding protein
VKRREFITLIGGAAATWPIAARAQQGERRVGVLMGYPESDAAAQAQVSALRQELRKLERFPAELNRDSQLCVSE